MTIMKAMKELKLKDKAALGGLTDEKLTDEIKTMEKTLFTMRMKLKMWEQKQTHLIKFLRRHIATAKTIAANKKAV